MYYRLKIKPIGKVAKNKTAHWGSQLLSNMFPSVLQGCVLQGSVHSRSMLRNAIVWARPSNCIRFSIDVTRTIGPKTAKNNVFRPSSSQQQFSERKWGVGDPFQAQQHMSKCLILLCNRSSRSRKDIANTTSDGNVCCKFSLSLSLCLSLSRPFV